MARLILLCLRFTENYTAFGFSFFHEFQLLASRGMESYTEIQRKHRVWPGICGCYTPRLGGKDYEDVMAFADYAARLPWVDEDRMGVTGGSYGGYMTNWVIGHTNRFKLVVTQEVHAIASANSVPVMQHI